MRPCILTWTSLALAVLVGGCVGPGDYTWVNQLPPEAASTAPDYVINAGDVVSIHVFNQDNMGTRAKVRSDGRLAVPLLGDIEARGRRPGDLARELEARLKPYVVDPHVTVTVEEFQSISVSAIGEVQHPGSFTFEPGAGIVQVLAAAGGLTEYADRDRIFVLRRAPTPRRIRFTYEAILRSEGRVATFTMQPGDVVVAE